MAGLQGSGILPLVFHTHSLYQPENLKSRINRGDPEHIIKLLELIDGINKISFNRCILT